MIIDKGNYYKIDPNVNSIILGHSHPECAYNDSLIDHFKNYSNSGSSYFYTYFKVKKLIEQNSQIKTVFIEFTNNQIDSSMNEWIWGNKFLSASYPKYCAFMEADDYKMLLLNNWHSVLNSEAIALKNNLSFLLSSKQSYINESNWGGYKFLIRDKTDSLINAGKNTNQKLNKPELSEANINYLLKIVKLCNSKNITVYLIRSPLHNKYIINNETEFKEILKQQFPTIHFLDFKNFPLKNEDFGDLEHLNHKGAKKYSLFINDLIKKGLLQSKDPQEIINNELKKSDRQAH
jgi:hypothetical protein